MESSTPPPEWQLVSKNRSVSPASVSFSDTSPIPGNTFQSLMVVDEMDAHILANDIRKVQAKGLEDIRASGTFHTWWNRQRQRPITRKIDRILGDHEWFSQIHNADCLFTPWGLSDHSVAILNIQEIRQSTPRPFLFFNFWLEHPSFVTVVKEAWGTNVNDTRAGICTVQASILDNPNRTDLIDQEKALTSKLWQLLHVQESVQHQKSRVQWLALGDQNTNYFHKKVSSNWNQNKILSLVDSSRRVITSESEIQNEALLYFKRLFSNNISYPGIESLQSHDLSRISDNQAQTITLKV
ncbi:hypothetical protein POM88_021984 [Heracleum sosnowskyi]|uniref:Endonuclease/exonuclease/phosphatase domain-containing protein n=1 Tax=Heracleum sosnowskyi TaxID=360622 RepID=A0AAD8IEF7_9APIA|nr:hypothetical protein POM88_021984 [Heracleum sosnowskyi]